MIDIVHQLREMAGPIVPNVCTQAADEIERLREERDEARREVCEDYAAYERDLDKRQDEMLIYAAKRGWDCFKEAP